MYEHVIVTRCMKYVVIECRSMNGVSVETQLSTIYELHTLQSVYCNRASLSNYHYDAK